MAVSVVVERVSVEDRVAQAETDIRNLADSILKLTELVEKVNLVQQEVLRVMGQFLTALKTGS